MVSKKSVRKTGNQRTRGSKKSRPSTDNTSLRTRISARKDNYLSRRPHRSFRRTRRRDYARSLKLPGYIAFTAHVLRTLGPHSKTFIALIVFSALSTGLLAGIASQETFTMLAGSLQEASQDILNGSSGEVQQAIALAVTAVTGGVSAQATESQQIFGVLIGILVWLTTVWLLRASLAGNKPSLREGLYNSGSPLIPSAVVFFLFLVQLLPAGAAIVGYSAAVNADFVVVGVIGALLGIVGLLLIVLSLYLVLSTFFALVIVTLPGMYPWQAIRAAGDLVVGRRLRLLYRLMWMVAIVAIVWMLVIVPIIVFSSWLQTTWQQTAFIPIVPLALLVMSSASTVFVSSYIYLLYRKVVEDDATPA